jgi:hypothetical protein
MVEMRSISVVDAPSEPASGKVRPVLRLPAEQGRETRQDECCERARLLYVGFTRARDHLILAARNRKGELEAQWLDELRDAAGSPLLRLPTSSDAEGNASLIVAGTQTRVTDRVWEVDVEPVATAPASDTTQALAWERPPPVGARPSYWITPSSAADAGRTCRRYALETSSELRRRSRCGGAATWTGQDLAILSGASRLPVGSSMSWTYDESRLADCSPRATRARASRRMHSSA